MSEDPPRTPFITRSPKDTPRGGVNKNMPPNVDFPATFLDYAGVEMPQSFQGVSFRPLLNSELPDGWQTSMYYRYWMHLAHHNVCAHYGLRTLRYKLIYYYGEALGQAGAVDDSWEPEWELFDLQKDPYELNSVYHDPDYAAVVQELKDEMHRLQAKVGDKPMPEID